MLRNKLVRSDGSIIDSSVIISCEFTEEVNSNTNLSVGDVTASEIAVEILSTDPIQQDEILTYFMIEDGVETKIGIFNAEKPTQATRTSMRFSAYDNIIKTEKLFSDWLRENQSQFPMTLLTLVETACAHCGVTLATTNFPRASMPVNAFYADNITCRQILSWVSAIAGCFVRANTAGALEFTWYTGNVDTNIGPGQTVSDPSLVISGDGSSNISISSENLRVTDDGAGNVSIVSNALRLIDDGAGGVILSAGELSTIPFKQGSLSYESYVTDIIERVQIKHSDDDVGVIYPEEATGNCFTIAENMILGAMSRNDVAEVASGLYTLLRDVTYVPFSVSLSRTIGIRAGERVIISDVKGNTFASYVMKMSVTPSGTTLSATGDKSYESNAAVASEKFSNLTGKILSISKSVDGLVITAEDLDGKISNLSLSVDEFRTYVQDSFVSADEFGDYKTTVSSAFEQTARGFQMEFEHVTEDLDDVSGKLDGVAGDVTGLGESLAEVKAHINPGILYYDSAGMPVYGIEIGQRNTINGEETFNKYAQFTSDKLAFYDQSDNEVASIGYRKMSITHAEITGSLDPGSTDYGSFKQGGFVDTTMADGGIVSKWVGGNK